MTIRVAINHDTHYKFDRHVNAYPHIVRLRPAPHSRTPIHSYSLKVSPENHFLNWQQDAFGNFMANIVFQEPVKEISIEVEVIADMTVINPFDFFLEDYAEQYPFKYPKELKKDLSLFLEKEECGDDFTALLSEINESKQRTIDFLVGANTLVQKMIGYEIRLEPGVQSPDETLSRKKGSCRDSAWLLVQVLRYFGLASRFASGYLIQLQPDEKPLEGPEGPAQDFTDLHAWCEVFIPGAGWVGLDPTSGLFCGEGHIPLACTPSPSSAAPIMGATDECEVDFDYRNEVTRILEDPRVTKPYSEKQWGDIQALGHKVDKDLDENDVRLTMGGEPTFVSVEDMESSQWNTEALGADKLKLAKKLLLKLRDEFAPKGMLHYGQGKWYPGEELPRWALGLYWRTDSEPMWKEPKYLAKIHENYEHGVDQAKLFIETLSTNMRFPEGCVMSAYEDAIHYLSVEQRVPVDVEIEISKAKTSLERKRLARVLTTGLDKPSAYVLPLEFDDSGTWFTSKWEFRRPRLTLIPGDSPAGLRLPLNELAEKNKVRTPERDPFEERKPLPSHKQMTKNHSVSESKEAINEQRQSDCISDTLVRTALCIEPREGKLHIFVPPLESLESYVDLMACVEATASELDMPVVIEGYEPPSDPRLKKLLVTPDPGVIEVNIDPSESWDALVKKTKTLYAAARECKLSAEKFMLDGRHTGTGGGNHITLGGKTPADSPLLRRPDLVQSIVTYWQHHPSLSYLFSGAFIGPTSQAPRADEGRDEALYELEIAFQQMPNGLSEQPWLVDRLMRNLLIDITGNTHRSELCIDKLYSPSGAAGRLGILEFRGFEMPPHSEMSCVQALLIRSLLLRFWKEPYKKPLARWGTSLHDKFMLPHFIWEDITDVVRDLNEHGIEFKSEWLLPFREFRFPHYGRVEIDGVEITLCWAIEPWHVLGEEVSSFGTSRYVDSSIERLQVKVNGLDGDRYLLSCNGRRLPLSNTGVHGEYVAGVRYRAWSPPSALHPTLPTNAPVQFDLIDTWSDRVIGGCTYHVSHPGGLSYESFPVNASEAESRRVNRFCLLEYTQKALYIPEERRCPEYPHTLDLRRQPFVL